MELTLSASRGWNERDASKEKVLGMDGGFRSSLFRYGISAIAILLAFAVRMLLDPYLGDYYPIVTFLVPVILIAWYGGLGPSIVAIIGALMLARYFFLAPRHSIGVEATEDQLGFALCLRGTRDDVFAQRGTAHRRTELSEEQARQLVANLQESEERLRLVLEASATGWWYWDLTHDVVQADAQVKALFGLPAEAEASFDVFLQSLAPGESERVLEELPGAIHSSSDFEREFHLIWPDGSHHWILARGRALRNAAGQPQRLMGLVLDITQRKQAERRLHEHTVQLQAITDHAQDFIVRFDRDLRHLFVNRARAEAVHISVDQYLGRTNEELGMPAECVALWNRHLRRVFETGQPESMEFDMELDGESRSFSSLIVPERAGEQGATETVLAITRDVTDAKRAEVALKMWNEELEVRVAERTAAVEQGAARLRMLAAELTQAEQSERRRLARILHDHLQQLLVAARMRISTLRRDAHNEKAAAMLQQIHELLDQCLAESRSLTVELSPPILNEAGLGPGLQWLARQMEEKHHLHVEVDVDSAAEPTCEVKRVFLFQAVRELLLNVVKHAQVDTAYVKVTPLENDGLRLVVADFGQGFDLAQLEGHRPSGGFGLFSIRERLEVLGGRLQIDAAPGRGARMVIEISRTGTALPDGGTLVETGLSLPRTATPPEPVETPVSRRERKTRVLLADDHAIVRQGLAGLLREHDAIDVVGEAVDGQEAVELTRQTRPDVVLMDITMPRLNGIEATRRIMKWIPQSHHRALDARGSRHGRRHAKASAAYFSKDVARRSSSPPSSVVRDVKIILYAIVSPRIWYTGLCQFGCPFQLSWRVPMSTAYRFSFGPWNIHEAPDPFGPTVRPTLALPKNWGCTKSSVLTASSSTTTTPCRIWKTSRPPDRQRNRRQGDVGRRRAGRRIRRPGFGSTPTASTAASPRTIRLPPLGHRPDEAVDRHCQRPGHAIDRVLARSGRDLHSGIKNAINSYRYLVDAQRVPRVRCEREIAIEPKPNEPMDHAYVPTIGHALALAHQTVAPRPGRRPDRDGPRHAGRPRPVRQMAFALNAGKLWSVHLNDQNGLKFDQDKSFGGQSPRRSTRSACWSWPITLHRPVHRTGCEGHADPKVESGHQHLVNSRAIFLRWSKRCETSPNRRPSSALPNATTRREMLVLDHLMGGR